MNYITERALYYNFMMQEVCEANNSSWKFLADCFGVDPKKAKEYAEILQNPIFGELSSLGDIEIYKNYLSGFGQDNGFGVSGREQAVIDVKAHALLKINDIFGENSIKSGRLRTLSNYYEKDRVASVVYALAVLYLNGEDEGREIAVNILMRELNEENNSDAGLLLLNIKPQSREEVMSVLGGTPEMLVRPDVLKTLSKRYGNCKGTPFKGKRPIGF